MKKYYTLVMIMLAAVCANARQLSPEEALSRLTSNVPAKVKAQFSDTHTPKLAMTINKEGFTSLYVFDRGENGYMIVSADDCAVPLLGYSDTEGFDSKNIPPQLQDWLDFYASEIRYAAKNRSKTPMKVAESRPERASIAPMTKSLWNQGAPYNDDCPLDNGKRSVTGCVATAMAQLMYYYKWPEKGTGSESYHWNVGDSTLSVNFADITFDWSDMTDTYNKESTAAQRAAVAQLMYACGVSVHMHYTSGESGAAPLKIGHALSTYFGYASNMASPQRYFYGLIDWENMVYGQLAQGMPVLYNGQGSEGGHQFICDGYSSDGYFHFNWGWSGMSDGYYLLSALDPMEQGIGGNLTGFNYEQGIWINAKPASSDSTETITPYIYGYGNFGTTATGSVELGKEVTFEASKNFLSFSNPTLKGRFGIAIESSDSIVEYVAHSGTVELSLYSGPKDFTVTLPTTLSDGTYTVTPAFMMESTGTWTPVLCSLSGVQALTMTVADGKASFASAEPAAIDVTSVSQNTPFYFGTKFSVTMDATNPGTKEYYGEIMLALVDENGKRIDNALMSETLNLPGGESVSVNIISDFPRVVKTDTIAAGSYYLQIYEYMTGNVLYTSSETVTIGMAPKTTMEVKNVEVADETETSTGKTAVHFSGVVECTEGYFAGQLQVRVYKKGSSETSAKAKTDYIFADLDEETPFTATVDLNNAKAGEEYYAEIYSNNEQVGTEKYYFTINNEMSGVEDVPDMAGHIAISLSEGYVEVSSASPVKYVRLYNMSGIVVEQYENGKEYSLELPADTLLPGVYIIVAADESGHTATTRFVQ